MKMSVAQGREHERAVAVAAESPAAPSRLRWLRKGELLILGGFIVLVLPWAFYLAYSLPSRHVTPHWDAAWAGFDLMMAGAAAWTVASIVRRSAYLSVAASVTGAFLVCDAWFDILTSRPGSELVTSGLFALFGELPLA